MNWIKASERLPEVNKNIIMKFPWHDNTTVLDEGSLNQKEELDNQLWFSTNNYGSIPQREGGLLWLDEQPEQVEPVGDAYNWLIEKSKDKPIGEKYSFDEVVELLLSQYPTGKQEGQEELWKDIAADIIKWKYVDAAHMEQLQSKYLIIKK